VKKIASLVNKIAVLFPFEVNIYRKTGLACEFVGHPITETVDISHTKKQLKENLGLDSNNKVLALLPGSRPAEISRHEQIIVEVAEKIHNEYPEMQIIVPFVSGTNFTDELPDYIKVISDCTTEVVACSEAVAVASGTATLEAALLGTPMVVFYKLSTLTMFFAKLLVKVKYISLVNLLSGKEVVKELVQKNATSDNLFSELKKILSDNEYKQTMVSNLQKIRDMMGQKTASERVASIIGELAGWSSTSV
jgi:lipid-A-disaccharide synthase